MFLWENERSDIQLEHDRQQGIIRDNVAAQFHRQIPDQSFADSDGIKVSEIVKKLVEKGGGRALYYNHQIKWDVEDLQEARQLACLDCIVPDGWDEPLTELEQINVDGHSKGHEYEITVEIFI